MMIQSVSAMGQNYFPSQTGSQETAIAVQSGGSAVAISPSHVPSTRQTGADPSPVGEEQVKNAIDRAFRAIRGQNTVLQVSTHEKTREVMIKVVNHETGEVIREIPPEKVLDFVAKVMEIAGILIDERA